MAQSDPWSRFYGKLGLNPAKLMTDKALRSIKSSFKTLTMPIADQRESFIIANFGGTGGDFKKRKKIHEFTIGALEAYTDVKDAYESGDYEKLLKKFNEKVSYEVFGEKSDLTDGDDGDDLNAKDKYLHGWSIINAQNSWLCTRASIFSHDAAKIKRSILNPAVTTLNEDMVSEPQSEFMVEAINKVIGPDFILSLEKKDILKNTVPISRLVSTEEIVVMAYFKYRPIGMVSEREEGTPPGTNQFDAIWNEFANMFGGDDLKKALEPCKEFILNFINQPGFEAVQSVALTALSLAFPYGMMHMKEKNWLLGLRKIKRNIREDSEGGYRLKVIRNKLQVEPNSPKATLNVENTRVSKDSPDVSDFDE